MNRLEMREDSGNVVDIALESYFAMNSQRVSLGDGFYHDRQKLDSLI